MDNWLLPKITGLLGLDSRFAREFSLEITMASPEVRLPKFGLEIRVQSGRQ